MGGKPADHAGAWLVHSDNLNRCSFAAELQHGLIENGDGGDIPEVSIRHVDNHPVKHFLEVERIGEQFR